MKKWLNKMRQALIRDVASATVSQLSTGYGWKEFLPPVVLRDCIYLVTKDGQIFRLSQDILSGFEVVTKISDGI